jgi:hypothetical protein
MPSPRAYSEAQVIATGIELEKTGPVTAKMLHDALGGRGDRYTAFGTWQAFMDQRQRLSGVPPTLATKGYSPAVNDIVTQIVKLSAALTIQVQTETAVPLERRSCEGGVRELRELLRGFASSASRAAIRAVRASMIAAWRSISAACSCSRASFSASRRR